jgi:hypothetical protein
MHKCCMLHMSGAHAYKAVQQRQYCNGDCTH